MTFHKVNAKMTKILKYTLLYYILLDYIYFASLFATKSIVELIYIRFLFRSAGANLSFPFVIEVVSVNNTQKEELLYIHVLPIILLSKFVGRLKKGHSSWRNNNFKLLRFIT